MGPTTKRLHPRVSAKKQMPVAEDAGFRALMISGAHLEGAFHLRQDRDDVHLHCVIQCLKAPSVDLGGDASKQLFEVPGLQRRLTAALTRSACSTWEAVAPWAKAPLLAAPLLGAPLLEGFLLLLKRPLSCIGPFAWSGKRRHALLPQHATVQRCPSGQSSADRQMQGVNIDQSALLRLCRTIYKSKYVPCASWWRRHCRCPLPGRSGPPPAAAAPAFDENLCKA